jgi:hypothetical protein
MPGSTPVYALPYDSLSDPPDGADMGQDLAEAIETELARIDAGLPDALPLANIAAVSVSITPVASTPTSGAVSWGKTLPGTVYAFACASSTVPGSTIVEVSVGTITSTGRLAWIYRTSTTVTTVHVLGIGL